ncbi:dephospho-CoA kinase [Fodinicurvata halophila]|uniref:Dephospho-CoA kinase n=1 Tax=Fodinicurvata halophila TaxID=1419723 RepID=A0ABV8UP62_9PROT
MRVLGLTGSIGMGKTTAARMLRRLGVPVHDADGAVHRLFAAGGKAVLPISREFPETIVDGAVDRQRLGARVFQDPAALRRLESVIHPLVRQEALDFLKRQRRRRAALVVLDIPLLFETGGEALCDAVIVVSAPRRLQRQRVMRRAGMSEERFQAILARQVPDEVKRKRADFVVRTGSSKAMTYRQLSHIVRRMRRGGPGKSKAGRTGTVHA